MTTPGMITIYAGTSAEEIGELTQLTIDEMKRAAEDMTEAEVRAARAQMKAGLLMGLESPSARAERNGAAAVDLGPRARPGGGGGQDRRRHHGGHPRLWRRPAGAEDGAGALWSGGRGAGAGGDPRKGLAA